MIGQSQLAKTTDMKTNKPRQLGLWFVESPGGYLIGAELVMPSFIWVGGLALVRWTVNSPSPSWSSGRQLHHLFCSMLGWLPLFLWAIWWPIPVLLNPFKTPIMIPVLEYRPVLESCWTYSKRSQCLSFQNAGQRWSLAESFWNAVNVSLSRAQASARVLLNPLKT